VLLHGVVHANQKRMSWELIPSYDDGYLLSRHRCAIDSHCEDDSYHQCYHDRGSVFQYCETLRGTSIVMYVSKRTQIVDYLNSELKDYSIQVESIRASDPSRIALQYQTTYILYRSHRMSGGSICPDSPYLDDPILIRWIPRIHDSFHSFHDT
jgi:hypothetical protein